MAGVSENGILDQADFAQYKSRSVHLKFLMQVFLTIGGAALLGLFTAVAGGAALTVMTVGLGVLGIGSLLLGSKYMFENQVLDQDFQAKKIGLAAAASRAIESPPVHEALPTGMRPAVLNNQENPDRWSQKFTQADEQKAWAEKLQQIQNTVDAEAVKRA